MRRELGQLSLADGLVKGGAGCNLQLDKIAALVDWAALERLLGGIDAAPGARSSHRAVVLLKCLFAAAVIPGTRSRPVRPSRARIPTVPWTRRMNRYHREG